MRMGRMAWGKVAADFRHDVGNVMQFADIFFKRRFFDQL
jgi:hypothetical protein